MDLLEDERAVRSKKRVQPRDPERKSRAEDWYSEHDNTLGNGFERVYSPDNRAVGFRVDGGFYG